MLFVITDRHEVQLCVNHFTMYCVTGSSKSKRAACKRKKIIALASEAAENCFSVYCVNCYQQKVTQQVRIYSDGIRVSNLLE